MSPSGDSLLLKLENLHRIVKKAKVRRAYLYLLGEGLVFGLLEPEA